MFRDLFGLVSRRCSCCGLYKASWSEKKDKSHVHAGDSTSPHNRFTFGRHREEGLNKQRQDDRAAWLSFASAQPHRALGPATSEVDTWRWALTQTGQLVNKWKVGGKPAIQERCWHKRLDGVCTGPYGKCMTRTGAEKVDSFAEVVKLHKCPLSFDWRWSDWLLLSFLKRDNWITNAHFWEKMKRISQVRESKRTMQPWPT